MKSQEEMMLAVLWSLGAEGARDKRRRPRVPVDNAIGWVLDPTGGIRQEVRMFDASAYGASFLFDAPLPVGHAFLLEFVQQLGDVPVLCNVTHCVSEGDQFRIGANFVRFLEPAPPHLRLTQPAPPAAQAPVEPKALPVELPPAQKIEQPQPVIQGRSEEMNPSPASQASSTTPFQQWLTAGESLYTSLLQEFQSMQAKLSEMESYLQQKGAEVNQMAHVLGKPAVPSTRLAAELVTHYGQPEPRSHKR